MKSIIEIAGVNAASKEELDQIIVKDIPSLTSKEDSFKEANFDAYSILINTWLWLISDNASPLAMELVKNRMLERGLTLTIASAASSNEEFIANQSVSDEVWARVLEEVRAKAGYRDYGYGFAHPEREITPEIFRVFNQLTKYPKRFTPLNADKFEARTWDAYVANQINMEAAWTENDTVARAMYVELVRNIISGLLPWGKICNEIRRILSDPLILPLTPGATATTSRSMLQKIMKAELFATDPCEIRTNLGGTFTGRWDEMQGFNKALQVPKNYKDGRVIAPEEFERASKGLAIYRMMEPHLPNVIKIKDQRYNQVLSLLGSSSKDHYDTLDLSFASDSQHFMMLNELYPTEFVRLIYPLLAKETRFTHPINVQYKGKQRRLSKIKAATALAMGHPLTFILECVTFAACGIAGHVLSGRRSLLKYPRSIEHLEMFRLPYNGGYIAIPSLLIVGDDIGIKSCYSEATRHILIALGFKVNASKSFCGDHPFRESCGKEYYKGIDVTPSYYPRSPIGSLETTKGVLWEYNLKTGESVPCDSLSKLVEIQHRMVLWSYHANYYITNVIRNICPHMTESAIGSTESDLWVATPRTSIVLSPYGYITEYYIQPNPRAKREYIPRDQVRTQIMETVESTEKVEELRGKLSNALCLRNRLIGSITKEDVRELCPEFSWIDDRIESITRELDEELTKAPRHRVETYYTAKGLEVFKDAKSHLVSLPGYDASYMESHTHCVATWESDHVLTSKEVTALSNYCYQTWLQHGPQYRSSDDTPEGIIERICGITYNPYRTPAGSFRKLLYGECRLIWKTK